ADKAAADKAAADKAAADKAAADKAAADKAAADKAAADKAAAEKAAAADKAPSQSDAAIVEVLAAPAEVVATAVTAIASAPAKAVAALKAAVVKAPTAPIVVAEAVPVEAPAPATAPTPAPAAPAAPAEAPAPPPPPRDIRQVQIRVQIVETNERGLRNLGANLNYTRFVDGVDQGGSVQRVTTNTLDPVVDFPRITLPVPGFGTPIRPDEDNNNANGIQAREGFGLTATVIDSNRGTVDAIFRGIEEGLDSDVVSRPEILVLNDKLATINAGGEVPFQGVTYTAKGVPQLRVDFKPIGVSLEMKPTIQPNDLIKLDIIKLDVTDTLRIENIRGVDLPVFSKRSQTGIVYVPSGQTLVTGGLTSRLVRQNERRVPLLGKLPVVGFPFRSRKSEANLTTLLIFVTPTVVDLRNMSPEGRRAMEFWKGKNWSNEKRVAAEMEAMEFE
ncbi:MAG: type II and III secretion system protein, partial [Candidatus Hydrogenedentes bacterium]|nr:type II and III secretion system protein [Candidatus Hydrogenedentota bacterium]